MSEELIYKVAEEVNQGQEEIKGEIKLVDVSIMKLTNIIIRERGVFLKKIEELQSQILKLTER